MTDFITRRPGNLIAIGNTSRGVILTGESNSLEWKEGEELFIIQTPDGKIVIERVK